MKKSQEILSRHEKSKPDEVKKPARKDTNEEYQTNLSRLNDSIEEIQKRISAVNEEIMNFNSLLNMADTLIGKIDILESQFNEIKKLFTDFIVQYNIRSEDCSFELILPQNYFVNLIEETKKRKVELQHTLNDESSLLATLKKLEKDKNSLISSADNNEKLYQKYLKDLQEWEHKKKEIIGGKYVTDTIEYYENELKYLDDTLKSDYEHALSIRQDLVKKIYNAKLAIVTIYQDIYAPVQDEIIKLLGELDSNISFQAEIFVKKYIAQSILGFINQRFGGKFGRGSNSNNEIEDTLRHTDFNQIDNVLNFVKSISSVATENVENIGKKIPNRQGFYDFIYGLSYIDITFKLKMDNRNLNELSAGERGIVLLIFYLALSQERKPIIIDQPEDNLDNQSIYKKLVPCICRAKQQRQVIIVTHNPNIAVACDAEQIVYCEMDKNTYQIKYESGAIENPEIRKHVIDVLEGTMPAFDLRRRKYGEQSIFYFQ